MDFLKIKIASFNCRGLNNEIKIMQLRDYFTLYKIDICLLQETHFNTKENLDKLNIYFPNHIVICPLSETKSRGVGILINSSIVDEDNLNIKFFENRIISLDFKINQTPLTLIIIYSPNLREEQVKFIEELHYFLYVKKNLIFGGDFNNSFEVNSDKGLEKKWDDLNKLFKLEEAFRPLENEDFHYTWTNGHHFSRIDRLYLGKNKNSLNLNYSECISNSISDHKIVISELSILDPFKSRKFKKNSDWKLNEQNLESKKIDKVSKESLNDLLQIIANRFRSIGHKIIQDHQTCSIFGRRMHDNIWLLSDMIEDSNKRKKELNIILADQQKAFDREFIFNNIKRIYNNSSAKIVLNMYETLSIIIKSGIKQGCALSMMLYIIAFEELMLRIKLNKNIKGYKIYGLEEREIKLTAYADDIVGYLRDKLSIELFFHEFAEWGEISGARINREKTGIVDVNNPDPIEDFKVLGVLFNKKGISPKNLENVIGKINQAIYLWDIPSLNMLERITIVKTFLLSKLWFIATFITINKHKIKELHIMIFRFIWNSKIELVKRETLILPFENGGMNMFHLESRLKTVSPQTYLYIRKNYQRDFYQLSIKWLKFHLRDLGLKNFNIIPYGGDKRLPVVYQFMIECQNEFKNYDKKFCEKNYTSKKTY
ncbi:unnamed protein product [Brachionus calyciflorus]|uniref:Reverse transcriptase domain-containing protein n=1 Tax=Brachionus calyciflorus TaxID=104777 RepID=A0A814C609_9BILA|nr:unnamed protein product [Brachionus calyciflorus]